MIRERICSGCSMAIAMLHAWRAWRLGRLQTRCLALDRRHDFTSSGDQATCAWAHLVAYISYRWHGWRDDNIDTISVILNTTTLPLQSMQQLTFQFMSHVKMLYITTQPQIQDSRACTGINLLYCTILSYRKMSPEGPVHSPHAPKPPITLMQITRKHTNCDIVVSYHTCPFELDDQMLGCGRSARV